MNFLTEPTHVYLFICVFNTEICDENRMIYRKRYKKPQHLKIIHNLNQYIYQTYLIGICNLKSQFFTIWIDKKPHNSIDIQ